MVMSLTQYSDVKAQASTLIWYMRPYSAWPYKGSLYGYMLTCAVWFKNVYISSRKERISKGIYFNMKYGHREIKTI